MPAPFDCLHPAELGAGGWGLGGSQIAVDAGLRSDAALPRRLRGVTWNAADNATTVWVLRVTFGPRSKTVHVRVESCSVQADSQGMMDSEEYELVEVRARTHTCVAKRRLNVGVACAAACAAYLGHSAPQAAALGLG
jgi:hypothetical protein